MIITPFRCNKKKKWKQSKYPPVGTCVNSDISTYNTVNYGAVKEKGVDMQVLVLKDLPKVYEMKKPGQNTTI